MTPELVTRVARTAPVGLLSVLAAAQAWHERGSIASGNWLGIAILAALGLAVVAASGAGVVAGRRVWLAAAALLGLAAWDAVSIAWSPVPPLARDEALLVVLYACALLLPAIALRAGDREAAFAVIPLVLGGVAVASAVEMIRAGDPAAVFYSRRLDFPVSYTNGAAAFFLVGAWPALALAARRTAPIVVRALMLGAATALSCGWLLAQSKGGALGVVVSTLVVLAATRARLRLVPPLAVAGILTAIGFHGLTAPYRVDDAAVLASIHHAGKLWLLLTAAGVVVGAAYAVVDRRTDLEHARPAIGHAALLAVVAGIATGGSLFFASVHDPGDFFAAQWSSFKHYTPVDTSTHLTYLGSDRYDFWRVAVHQFADHPLGGVGARGFRTVYLLHRKSNETPARAHSVELDALSETGVVGFALLAAALVLVLASFARRARDDLVAVGALGTFACWLTHASVDWTWSFPAIGLLAFALFGIAAAGDGAPLPRRPGLGLAAAAAALALGGFGVPWLAYRYVQSALSSPASAGAALRRSRALDPLSVNPDLAQWAIAAQPVDGIAPLADAVRMEPRSADLWYALGRQQQLAGRTAAARRSFERALALDPGEPTIRRQLR